MKFDNMVVNALDVGLEICALGESIRRQQGFHLHESLDSECSLYGVKVEEVLEMVKLIEKFYPFKIEGYWQFWEIIEAAEEGRIIEQREALLAAAGTAQNETTTKKGRAI